MKDIFKIAIVENEDQHMLRLKQYLDKYAQENGYMFDVQSFCSGEVFLEYRKEYFDLVFMDIELDGVDGIYCAKKLREKDSYVAIIFVTNFAQYAVNGYEVSALDFLVKPLTYKNFSLKLKRAISIYERRQDKRIVVYGKTEKNSMNARSILFVEISGHKLSFHKTDGEVIDVTGTLSALYDELHDYGFALCNSCYLVNMNYIKKVDSLYVTLSDDTKLQMSARKKKSFIDTFTTYIGSSFI